MKRDLDYMISVMTAAREGKKIEGTWRGRGDWAPVSPNWNWTDFDYRVKREPGVIWVNELSRAELAGHPGFVGYAFNNVDAATSANNNVDCIRRGIKFIEVLEDSND